jgi:uncharacterized membrane protein
VFSLRVRVALVVTAHFTDFATTAFGIYVMGTFKEINPIPRAAMQYWGVFGLAGITTLWTFMIITICLMLNKSPFKWAAWGMAMGLGFMMGIHNAIVLVANWR